MPDDPLGILLLCSHCHKQFDPLRHRPLCDCQFEDAVWEPYMPIRHIPEGVIEKLRAEHLEFNARGGPRKLTEAELGHTAPLTDEEREEIARLENEGGPVEPELDEVPDELPDGLRPGFG